MSSIQNLCDCSSSVITNAVVQCRSCGQCDGSCNDILQRQTERRIQNQSGVSQSQMINVKSAIYIAQDFINHEPCTDEGCVPVGSRVWGHPMNLRNLSDQREPSNYSNPTSIRTVPSRGNSVSRSLTRNRPGSMAPGGIGVDVKHGSYARYLGKLTGNYLISNKDTHEVSNTQGSRPRPAFNNKQYRFSIISNTCDCNKLPE